MTSGAAVTQLKTAVKTTNQSTGFLIDLSLQAHILTAALLKPFNVFFAIAVIITKIVQAVLQFIMHVLSSLYWWISFFFFLFFFCLTCM